MGGVAIIVIILAFIGNRIFGLYKDETTTKILEDAGAIPRRKSASRTVEGGCSGGKRQSSRKLTPYQRQFQKDRAILKQMSSSPYGRKLLRQYRLEV